MKCGKVGFLLCIAAVWLVPSRCQEFSVLRRWVRLQHSIKPKDGFVPDAKTSIAIATPVLKRIYGDRLIDNELPLRAEEKHGIWTVTGTFHGKAFGGTAVLQLRRSDGQILFVGHEE